MRRAFGMMWAIIFIILISLFIAFSLSVSSSNLTQTSDTYLSEQAELLARGATEYAMLRILKHDFIKDGCLENLDGSFTPPDASDKLFEIKIKIKHIGDIGSCISSSKSQNVKNIKPGNVIIDVWVSYAKDKDKAKIKDDMQLSDEMQKHPITFHRRTLQKL
ncbi:hypothetical protein [Campylobacter mucosalis]|uniref:Type II secretion system protein n=1 Tax=Campylobacter mucosalis CCUG 21559 TaxID=1032067 RepID=A0A6G5QIH1_9BACT|nr:hypothetical protein [Campylobacter mucosalis]KEA45494.1 hypothetical protein CR66_07355 [Campylobacter mucosalis]QCD45422.1 hypothetical protein CMUC_1673 [Campylobacter mucosalis CCUG 21559]QKF63337.1 hypothetical protein CMCT_1214 [Campylobacter mucosalis]